MQVICTNATKAATSEKRNKIEWQYTYIFLCYAWTGRLSQTDIACLGWGGSCTAALTGAATSSSESAAAANLCDAALGQSLRQLPARCTQASAEYKDPTNLQMETTGAGEFAPASLYYAPEPWNASHAPLAAPSQLQWLSFWPEAHRGQNGQTDWQSSMCSRLPWEGTASSPFTFILLYVNRAGDHLR